MEAFISQHGYLVLVAGSLLEGETVVVLAAFAAHLGYLDPFAVFAIAALCGWTSDQVLFHVGRRYGMAVIGRFAFVARRVERVHGLIERNPWTVAIGVRFAYGLRIAGPMLIGTSAMPGARFAAMNAVGALLWAGLGVAVGWFFGAAAQALFGRIEGFEAWLFAALAVAGMLVWAIARWRSTRAAR